EAVEVSKRADERFLCDVLGDRAVPHHEIRDAERDLLVPLDEPAERITVTAQRRAHRRSVARRSVHLGVIHRWGSAGSKVRRAAGPRACRSLPRATPRLPRTARESRARNPRCCAHAEWQRPSCASMTTFVGTSGWQYDSWRG